MHHIKNGTTFTRSFISGNKQLQGNLNSARTLIHMQTANLRTSSDWRSQNEDNSMQKWDNQLENVEVSQGNLFALDEEDMVLGMNFKIKNYDTS